MTEVLKFGVMFERNDNRNIELETQQEQWIRRRNIELGNVTAVVRPGSLVELVAYDSNIRLSPMQKFFATEEEAVKYAEASLRRKNNPSFSYYIVEIKGKVSTPKMPLEYTKFENL